MTKSTIQSKHNSFVISILVNPLKPGLPFYYA